MSELLPWIVGLIFAAGTLYAGMRIGLRQVRKDLNGAMSRNREDHREIGDELHNLTLAFLVILEHREDRAVLAEFLKR